MTHAWTKFAVLLNYLNKQDEPVDVDKINDELFAECADFDYLAALLEMMVKKHWVRQAYGNIEVYEILYEGRKWLLKNGSAYLPDQFN